MSINGISFGSVVAVSGKKSKINKLNNKLKSQALNGNIIMKDVTQHYKHATSSGLMAQAAQRGNSVEIYITGKDVEKIKTRQQGWETLDGILSNLSSYICAEEMSLGDVFEKIIES